MKWGGGGGGGGGGDEKKQAVPHVINNWKVSKTVNFKTLNK